MHLFFPSAKDTFLAYADHSVLQLCIDGMKSSPLAIKLNSTPKLVDLSALARNELPFLSNGPKL